MDIGSMLGRSAVAARVHVNSKRQVLNTAAEVAGRITGRKPDEILAALVEREQAGSTGVGNGVALPHAHLPGLERLTAVFLKLEEPVAFAAVDDRPVDLIFALFAPDKAGAEHLQALAKVSRLLRQRDLREQLRQAQTATPSTPFSSARLSPPPPEPDRSA
jgi:PTS system nitrogen regulatory IIA component